MGCPTAVARSGARRPWCAGGRRPSLPRAYRAYWSWVSSFNQHEGRGVEEGLALLERYPDLQPLYLRLASVCSPQERVVCERAIQQARPEEPLTVGYQQAALALRHHPNVNSSWGDEAITLHGEIHIGVAVATPLLWSI